MISVLTLTYKRRALLEEAIYSFLLQGENVGEMLVINDCPEVWYDFYHPRVKIYNLDERFSSLGKKLEYGFGECRMPYVYRLDDDDLLAPNALRTVMQDIHDHPGHDVYRTRTAHFMHGQHFRAENPNTVNTGNTYTQSYLSRVVFPNINYAEDCAITFEQGASIYTADHAPTMVYRLGMPTYNLSNVGIDYEQEVPRLGDHDVGYTRLTPQFRKDYWAMILEKSW